MSPPSAKRLADRLQAWSPSFAGIGNSTQDSLPRSTEEVKQKLRSWNKSLGRHFSKREPYNYGHGGGNTPYAIGEHKTRTSLEVFAAQRAGAEKAKLGEELVETQKFERCDSRLIPNHASSRTRESILESRRSTPSIVELKAQPSKTNSIHGKRITRQSLDVRESLPSLMHPSSRPENKIWKTSEIHRTIHDKDRTYEFKFQRSRPHSATPTATPVLRHSASASNLADHVIDSVKRFRRSASHVSLRRKFTSSDSDGETTPQCVSIDSFRRSTPAPAGRPSSIQKSYTSLDLLYPDQSPGWREPGLESIAENNEPQLLASEVVRQDLIFALHESRVCSPRAPPTFVERLPYDHARTYIRPCRSFSELERASPVPRSMSSREYQRSSTTSIQLTEQISRFHDMVALRTSINNIRTAYLVPTLLFFQDLCAEAKFVATTFEILHGNGGGGTWGTRIQFQEGSATLELIGPPGIGGRSTGKMWADGAFSRDTERSHSRFSTRDHEGCQCRNYKVWKAITDVRWRAVGLSRTEDEERWVVVLSE